MVFHNAKNLSVSYCLNLGKNNFGLQDIGIQDFELHTFAVYEVSLTSSCFNQSINQLIELIN